MKLSKEAIVSLQGFGGTITTFLLITYFLQCFVIHIHIFTFVMLIVCSGCVTLYFILRYTYNENNFQIAIRAALLGLVLSIGIFIRFQAPLNMQIFGSYMVVMATFHYSEFLAISIVRPSEVSTDSFVINHSPQYIIAAVTSWIEFFVESYFFPQCKEFFWISNIGVCICILGEILRKTAILTAGSNFNHLVQCEKSSDHVLVTKGVYGWFRHPSYVGWFYWSIGTQIILINPICIPAYAVASWLFFKSRVYIEEIMLLNFFGQEYCDYQQKVGTGIPFIEGYKIGD